MNSSAAEAPWSVWAVRQTPLQAAKRWSMTRMNHGPRLTSVAIRGRAERGVGDCNNLRNGTEKPSKDRNFSAAKPRSEEPVAQWRHDGNARRWSRALLSAGAGWTDSGGLRLAEAVRIVRAGGLDVRCFLAVLRVRASGGGGAAAHQRGTGSRTSRRARPPGSALWQKIRRRAVCCPR
jgi:hypothetical protein